jgi:hypothetical protein
MVLRIVLLRWELAGTTLRPPPIPRQLTHKQAPLETSASSASAEPVVAAAQGLQLVAEGIDPMIEYVSLSPYCSINS